MLKTRDLGTQFYVESIDSAVSIEQISAFRRTYVHHTPVSFFFPEEWTAPLSLSSLVENTHPPFLSLDTIDGTPVFLIFDDVR